MEKDPKLGQLSIPPYIRITQMAKKKAVEKAPVKSTDSPSVSSYIQQVAKGLDMSVEELKPYWMLIRKGERYYPVKYVVERIKNERKGG
tara:strand:- start:799 stop:1065 length:267 start_codon:yes stop_codon:yes gene_type:complete